jgi:4-hydroxybenzoate polyprenyltransferase
MSLYSNNAPDKSVALSDIAQGLRRAGELTRPLTSAIPALLTGVVVLASAKISPAMAMRASLAVALTTMTGFLFDNIYDLPADRAAGQPTPLTQGLVSIFQSRGLAGTLAVCAILLDPAGALGKLTLSATLLALWLYSYAAHWAPWLKNAYSALLVCVPLFYGSLIAGVSVPLAYYFVLGLFVLGRESLIDAHQADADRKAGFRTLAILLGRSATEICGALVVVMAGVLLICFAPGTTARVLAGICVAAIAAVLAMPLPAIRRTGLLRIPMTIGVVTIGLSLSLR